MSSEAASSATALYAQQPTPHVPPLQPNDYWIDAEQSAQWFADGVFELVSPLDGEQHTVIELSEEQEVFLEWLTTHHIQHIRVQEVP